GSTAGGTAGGSTAGGTAGGSTAGGTAGGSTAGGTAGGSTAGGTAGGSTAGGTAGGSTAGGTAGGATAGGTAGGATAGGSAGGGSAQCALPSAGTLAPNSSVAGSINAAAGSLIAGCTTSTVGAEDIWSFSVNSTQTVKFETTPSVLPDGGAYTIDSVLYVRSQCADAGSELGCSDEGTSTFGPSRFSAQLTPGSYSVIVERYSSTIPTGGPAPYGLTATAVPSAANASCATPTALVEGTPTTGQSTESGGAVGTSCAVSNSGPQRFYSFSVPAATRATFTVTPQAPAVSVVRRLVDSCAATTCLASGSGTTAGTLVFDNRGGAPTTAIVSVAATRSGTDAVFDVSVATTPITLSANAQCSAATALVVDAAATAGETIQTGGTALTNCVTAQAGPVRYYTVDVPAGGAVSVTATSSAFNVGLRQLSNCGATTCDAFSNNTSSGAEALRLTNSGATTRTFTIAVSASTLTSTGTYSIQAVTAAPVPPTNAFCAGPTVLTAGTPVTGERIDIGGQPLSQCLPSQTGYVRYYSVAVPANNTLQAVVTPNGADYGVRLLDSCSATSCAASADVTTTTTSSGLENVIFTNSTSASTTALIAVSSANTGATSTQTFGINAIVAPTPSNAFCASATALVANTPLTAQSLAGGAAAPTGCLATANGPVRYYSVTLAAGAATNVVATPTGLNVNLRLLPSCGATTCTSSVDASSSTTSAGAETLFIRNSALTSQTFTIAVGSPSGTTTGTFDIAAIPYFSYVRSVITPTACDDMTTATALASAVGDDVSSPLVALPSGFAFSFFGTPVTNFSVSSNGFVQLWPTSTGSTSTTAANSAIPTTGTPNNFVAPFWDDLVNASGTGAVSYLTSGSAPNRRFTVEWANFYPYNGGVAGPERLRFQVQLNETSNLIEFHYCALDVNGGDDPRTSGNSATVGVENFPGNEGVQSSYNTAGSVSTSNAFRFTPQ
ncbi:MAG: hypothetical protein JNM69_42685, partial [Archangium sp.]|nr:hypothetical protein [Archangium sp.]